MRATIEQRKILHIDAEGNRAHGPAGGARDVHGRVCVTRRHGCVAMAKHRHVLGGDQGEHFNLAGEIMTATAHKLEQIYAKLGGRIARAYSLAEVRDAAIRMEFEATGYHQEQTADNLGVCRTTMCAWLKAQRAVAACLIIALCLCASVVQAENLYVRPNGGAYGAENGSNWENAFDGFSDVAWGAEAGQLGSGDTLYVGAGSYTVGLDNGGQGGWTLRAAQESQAGAVTIATGTTFSINLRGYSNIEINGRGPNGETNFTLLDNLLPSSTEGSKSTGTAVSYCKFTNAVFSAPYATGVRQTNNLYVLQAGTGEESVYSNNGSGNAAAYDQAWVVNCQVFVPCASSGGFSPDGLQPGDGTTIIGCTFRATVGANTSPEHQDLIQTYGNNYIKVIGCEFIDSADSLLGCDMATGTAGHIRVYNCIFRRTIADIGGNALVRVYTSLDAPFTTLTDMVFENNTFVDAANHAVYGAAFLIQDGNSSTTTTSCVFRNNIIFDCGATMNAITIEDGYLQTGWTFTHNLINAGASGNTTTSGWTQSNGQTGNPSFVTYTQYSDGNSYSIQSGSPAKDVAATGTLAYDFAGAVRPQGAAWDIGAFEYLAAAAPAQSGSTINATVTRVQNLILQ